MPVLLTSEDEYAAWLNLESVERGPLQPLHRQVGSEGWASYQADR
jgi:hypothetical protein